VTVNWSNENNGFEAAGVRFEARLLVVAFPEPDLAACPDSRCAACPVSSENIRISVAVLFGSRSLVNDVEDGATI